RPGVFGWISLAKRRGELRASISEFLHSRRSQLCSCGKKFPECLIKSHRALIRRLRKPEGDKWYNKSVKRIGRERRFAEIGCCSRFSCQRGDGNGSSCVAKGFP